MKAPNHHIIKATPEWAHAVSIFCQHTWQAAYTKPKIGVTRDLLSKEVFQSSALQHHFLNVCTPRAERQAWIMLNTNNEIIGLVGASRQAEYCEMDTFYVATEYMGKGLGHELYLEVLTFAGELPILVDVVEYMTETIQMYEHWGFKIDHSRGKKHYPWPWPEKALRAYVGVYMIKP